MTQWRILCNRLIAVFRPRQRDTDLDEELRAHLEMAVDDYRKNGLDEKQAREKALRDFGGVVRTKELYRDLRSFPALDAFLQDLRYALRIFAGNPIFTAVVVLTLALGIGANTAIFSLMNGLMLKSLPVRDPGRLVEIKRDPQKNGFTNPIWEYIRDKQEVFDSVLAFAGTAFNLATSGEIHRAQGLYVSGSFFDTLGVRPVLGRLIAPTDDVRGCGTNGPVAVLSYGFWQGEYGGRPAALNRSITIDGREHTIIGVTPPDFFGVSRGEYFDVATPLCTNERQTLANPLSQWLSILARLKPGQTVQQAMAGLGILQPSIREATLPAGQSEPRFIAQYLKEPFSLIPAGSSTIRTQYERPLWVLMTIVVLVLLVACGNIASLLLARATARAHEIALRFSIGASRGRLIRQLLVESLVLSVMGATLGYFFAQAAGRVIVRGLLNIDGDLSPDWRVFAFTLAVAVATGVIFGIAPAIQCTRWNSAGTFSELRKSAGAFGPRTNLGRWLVCFQIALSLALVFGAALFLRSYRKLVTVDHGFRAENILMVNAYLPGLGFLSFGQNKSFETYMKALDAIRELPQVRSAAYSSLSPVTQLVMRMNVATDTFHPTSEGESLAAANFVSPDYFATFGIPLMAGRDFDSRDVDQGRKVAIVNETFSRKFFPGRNPIGMTFRRGTQFFEIVGVVGDASYESLRDPVPPTEFLPVTAGFMAQLFSIRTPLSGAAITPQIVSTFQAVDKNFTVRVQTLQTHINDSILQDRLMATLSLFFGFLALLIAAVGQAGLVGYSVVRRRAEIGVRAAIGATPGSLVRLVMRDVIILTGFGIVLGMVLGIAGGRFLSTMLYQVRVTDSAIIGTAVGTLALVAVLAGYIPARRAAKIDPAGCLRSQ